MALADFIQSLQSQDIVYSTPPQPSIRVIPPEKDECLKVIPPDGPVTGKVELKSNEPKPQVLVEEKPAPKTIKLKIKQKQVPTNEPASTTNTSTESIKVISQPTESEIKKSTVTSVSPPIETKVPEYKQEPIKVSQPIEQPRELTDDEIFNSTGTEYSKKDIWIDYFNKAKSSRKSNPIVERMKIGRFTITPDNKVLLLPDYDIVGKDPDDVLRDKWF